MCGDMVGTTGRSRTIRAEGADVLGGPQMELQVCRFQLSESKRFLTVRTDEELDPSEAVSGGSECLIARGWMALSRENTEGTSNQRGHSGQAAPVLRCSRSDPLA